MVSAPPTPIGTQALMPFGLELSLAHQTSLPTSLRPSRFATQASQIRLSDNKPELTISCPTESKIYVGEYNVTEMTPQRGKSLQHATGRRICSVLHTDRSNLWWMWVHNPTRKTGWSPLLSWNVASPQSFLPEISQWFWFPSASN